MKVEVISEIHSPRGVIPAGKILDMPEALVLKLAGKVKAITPPLNGGRDLPHYCEPVWCSVKINGSYPADCIRVACEYYQQN